MRQVIKIYFFKYQAKNGGSCKMVDTSNQKLTQAVSFAAYLNWDNKTYYKFVSIVIKYCT